MTKKLYNKKRDIIQLDIDGNYYCNHICAMTRESLHDKSDIAAELGYRDKLIADLYKNIVENNHTNQHNPYTWCEINPELSTRINEVLK